MLRDRDVTASPTGGGAVLCSPRKFHVNRARRKKIHGASRRGSYGGCQILEKEEAAR